MNYNRLDSHHMVSYIYSLKLDKGTQEAEFSFVRFKDKDIKNKLAKDNSLAISLPADLETLEAGKAVNWNGAVKASDETIEVVMVKDDKKQYSEYFAEVTPDGKGFVFGKLPEEKFGGFILFNTKYGTRNVIVRNCYFHDNRARGILLLGRDITLENNRFRHNEMGAIKIETGYTFNVWSEGYGADNIVVRNNSFDSVNPRDIANDGKARDIYMGVYMKTDPSTERTRYPILSNILFENNRFRDSFGLVAFISSAGNVTFRGNTFENPTARRDPLPYRAAAKVLTPAMKERIRRILK